MIFISGLLDSIYIFLREFYFLGQAQLKRLIIMIPFLFSISVYIPNFITMGLLLRSGERFYLTFIISTVNRQKVCKDLFYWWKSNWKIYNRL